MIAIGLYQGEGSEITHLLLFLLFFYICGQARHIENAVQADDKTRQPINNHKKSTF
jgi:hypothetical protein